MKFSDGDDAMAGGAQPMMPARYRAVIGISVVPKSDLMDVLSCREGCPRRNANRRGSPAGGKPRALRRQPVQIGRLHDGMAVAAHHLAIVLIGHNDQQVPSFHPIPRNRFMASPEPFRPNLALD